MIYTYQKDDNPIQSLIACVACLLECQYPEDLITFEDIVSFVNSKGFKFTVFMHEDLILNQDKFDFYIAVGRNADSSVMRHAVIMSRGQLVFNPKKNKDEQELLTEEYYIGLEKL